MEESVKSNQNSGLELTNDWAITVWEDGSSKAWRSMDALYAETDPGFLVNIPLGSLKVFTDEEDREFQLKMRQSQQ